MKNFHIENNSVVPQSKKQSKKQKRNAAGGFSFKIDKWQALQRFLILGTEGGSIYQSEKSLTKDRVKSLDKCLKEDPERAVKLIVDLSVQGRVINTDTAVFALAYCSAHKDEKVRTLANKNTSKVLRTFTHVSHYMNYSKQLREGFGAGFRKGVARYYLETPVEKLSMHMLKYRQRDGWTHGDILRLTHPETDDPTRKALFQFATQGIEGMGSRKVTREREYAGKGKQAYTWNYTKGHEGKRKDLPQQVEAFVEANDLNVETKKGQAKLISLITEYRLTHEMIPTEARKIPEVWEALAIDMPLGAILRNLSTFGRLDLLKPLKNKVFTDLIVEKLSNEDALKRARIHPASILLASKAYSFGRRLTREERAGEFVYISEGNKEWNPVTRIQAVLDKAFYASFGYIKPTGKNFLLAIDCSASMSSMLTNLITNREAAAVMAMVTARVEENYHVVGFTTSGQSRYSRMGYGNNSGIRDLDISPSDSLATVCGKMSLQDWGGTDCSLPFTWAQKEGLEVDAFGIFTDADTWAGVIHPHIALQKYRKNSGIPAVSFVVAMMANNISIADPNDAGMIDLTGFDPNTPRIISEFVSQID